MVSGFERRSDETSSEGAPEKGLVRMKSDEGEDAAPISSIEQKFRELRQLERRLQDENARRERARAKEAKAAQRKEDREAVAQLRAFTKNFCREHANRLRPRKKAARRTEAELLKLFGGKKDVILLDESRRQTRIIFGGVGETRLIFTPDGAGWKIQLDVDVDPELSPEELKSELAKSGRGLWDNDKQKPVIAFQAVNALLTCWRDWQDFTALPESEQEKADFYRAMVNVHLAILTTLEALKRDDKNESRKLQVAFALLNDPQWPTQIGELRYHARNLAVELQRPPYKKELKDRFEQPLPPHHSGRIVRPSEFSSRLKAAGLSWLKRGNFHRGSI
jgi:hypothetical protein